ncbi:hypothetical protein [Nitrosomonas sp. Nm166]|uniref:hypothetical protein n=1 Tax=Nitrosomonas sp. Nm166 TaxID=1881054 RepID=UPI0008E6F206|nr:hypothetical protein [Nitrosomonas sp. Nm166]SFF10751.1 hypothetical protein SAMN05428977_10511 [Nitrosomonas sp. Nm166]
MPTRKTEQRLPTNATAAVFGQAEGDATAVLISYHSSPVVKNRTQTYVVFVLDATMQTNAESYRWQIGSETVTTPQGVLEYAHTTEGDAQISVEIRDGASTVLKTLSLTQSVIPLNAELEAMVNTADEVTPTAADPETSRELVNDVRVYIDELAPRSLDGESSLNKLLFAVAYAEAMLVPPTDRAAQTERLAAALEEGTGASFAEQAKNGIGLCQVRPAILAMYRSATPGGSDWLITRREFPHDTEARGTIQTELDTALAELDETRRIDLFNLLRFPKSNLNMTMQLLEAFRNQYYPGQSLPSILADEAKAKTLISQYKEGPFALA